MRMSLTSRKVTVKAAFFVKRRKKLPDIFEMLLEEFTFLTLNICKTTLKPIEIGDLHEYNLSNSSIIRPEREIFYLFSRNGAVLQEMVFCGSGGGSTDGRGKTKQNLFKKNVSWISCNVRPRISYHQISF